MGLAERSVARGWGWLRDAGYAILDRSLHKHSDEECHVAQGQMLGGQFGANEIEHVDPSKVGDASHTRSNIGSVAPREKLIQGDTAVP